MPYCISCGSMIDEYDSAYYARNMLCIPCYNRKASEVPMVSCGRCGVRIRRMESNERMGSRYCNYCHSELERASRLPICPVCGIRIDDYQKSERAPDGKMVHSSCRDKRRRMAVLERSPRGASPSESKKTILGMMLGRIASMVG